MMHHEYDNDELQSFIDDNSEELMHYGRKGMKWYQHIYGAAQATAKYAKKAGTKVAEAKASHDEKQKEKAIQSGDLKKVNKYKTKMTNTELKTAYDRVDMVNKNNPNSNKKDKNNNQNGNKNNQKDFDPVKAFSNMANNLDTTYKAVDTLMSTYNKAKQWTPEARARKAEVNDIIKNMRVNDFLNNQSKMTDDEVQRFQKRFSNISLVMQNAGKYGDPTTGKHNINPGKHSAYKRSHPGKHDADGPTIPRGKHDKHGSHGTN